MTDTSQSRVAVIGSTSFSGSSLIDMMLGVGGYDILGISRSAEDKPALQPHLRHGDAHYRFAQHHLVRDPGGTLAALDAFRPEYIVNFAAQGEVPSSFTYPERHFETNALAMVRLAEALRERDYLKRYVHISTPEVYGTCEGAVKENQPLNPSSPYAASKASADLFLNVLSKTYDFPVVTVRATNVYGPYQQLYRIIPRTIIYIRLGRKIRLDGGGKAVKSYIHIDDVSRGEIAIMKQGDNGAIYHLSPDESVSIRQVVETVCRHMGAKFEDVVEMGPERIGQDKAYVIDSGRARQELGWQPVIDFESSIPGIVEWIDTHWQAIKEMPLDYEFSL